MQFRRRTEADQLWERGSCTGTEGDVVLHQPAFKPSSRAEVLAEDDVVLFLSETNRLVLTG